MDALYTTTARAGWRHVILLDRDNGRVASLTAGDEILIELDAVPEDEYSLWRVEELPEGVFAFSEVWIQDGTFTKSGHRLKGKVGKAATRRFFLAVCDGGPEEGRIRLTNGYGATYEIDCRISGRVRPLAPTGEELFAEFARRHNVPLRLTAEDGLIKASWHRRSLGDDNRHVEATSFAAAVAGALWTERELRDWWGY